MSDAATALRQAIHARLSSDAALTGLLGANRLLDRPPQGVAMPFLLYGPVSTSDYSTGTEPGEEHLLSLDIWTDPSGQKPALAIAARLKALLDDASLPLAGTALVSLDWRSTRTRRDPRARASVMEVTFRAVTEG
nr:DUF3168 domain-containing protein [uncultured Gellertiella sp.]